jgi:PAS domain S-box-containing protein
MQATGTIASIVVPVFDDAVPRAMLCLEDCARERAWDEGEEEALVNLAAILGGRMRRHRVEQRLRYQEERHRRILEELPYGVTHIDAGGRHTYANPAFERLFAIAAGDLRGRYVWDVASPEEREVARKMILGAYQAPAAGGMFTGRTRRSDGRAIDVQVDWTKDFGPDGRVVGATAVVTDITERVRERGELERSVRDKGVLLREVHHRVKNNLQIVASLLRLTRCGDQATYEEVLHAAERRVASIAIVHDVLTRGDEVSEVDLCAYLLALVESLRGCLGVPPREIRIEQRCEELRLSLDVAVPIGLALNEAITNALEHAFVSRRTGTVRVDAHRSAAGGIAIRVEDDGCGLSADVDPDDPQTLGLQLVRELTAQVGGLARVRSSDAGTEVLLTIPRGAE